MGEAGLKAFRSQEMRGRACRARIRSTPAGSAFNSRNQPRVRPSAILSSLAGKPSSTGWWSTGW